MLMKIKQLVLVLFFAGTVFSACKNKASGGREDTGEQQVLLLILNKK
jgi:predicted small secreted protein